MNYLTTGVRGVIFLSRQSPVSRFLLPCWLPVSNIRNRQWGENLMFRKYFDISIIVYIFSGKDYSGIVPYVTTPLKGRFVVFSQCLLIGYFRLGYIRLVDCPQG